jgi:iron complex outermembrane receptor protein
MGLLPPARKPYADLGFYLQDQVKLLEKVTVTAGIRYDYSYFDIPIKFGENAPGGYFSEYAFSPKVGITYEFVPGVAAIPRTSDACRSLSARRTSIGTEG